MWNCNFCFLALFLFVPLTLAKDKPQLPKLIVNARFVLVTTYFGDEPANPRNTPDDLQTVTDVQDAIKKWGRYTLVYKIQDADVVFLVRKGRVAEAHTGVRIHAGSEVPSPTAQPDTFGNVGDPQDTIVVLDAANGLDSPPLWRGREIDGLKRPDLRLVQELRTKVDAAARTP